MRNMSSTAAKTSSPVVHCHVDHHPSAIGMYITASTLFATLTGLSPVGRTVPAGERVPFFIGGDDDGMFWRGTQRNKVVRLPVIDPADGAAAQRAAADVVMHSLSAWNPTLGESQGHR